MKNKMFIVALICRCLLPLSGYSQGNANISSEQYSYLAPKAGITIALMDNGAVSFDPQKVSVIQSGTHTFEIIQQQTVQGQSSGSTARSGNVSVSVSVSGPSTTIFSGLITIDADLEPGKYYAFDYKKSHKGIFKSLNVPDTIVEITDSKAVEKMNKSLTNEKGNLLSASDWSRKHPEILDGTYTSGKKQIIFTGNTFHISVSAIINSPFVYEGEFYYTDKMITLRINSLQTGKKEKKPTAMAAFLYYDLTNDMLNITGLREGVGTILPSVKGKYYKGSGSEPVDNIASENTENGTVNTNDNSPVISENVSAASPASWGGTYKTQNGKKQITFSGNTFHISLPAPLSHYIYDGTYSFKGETIVLNIESYKYGKLKVNMNNTVVLDYKLTDNMLEIINETGDAPAAFSAVKGQYYLENDKE